MENIRQSDIAKALNVSRVTVSKALRDHPDISQEMKLKVREAVEHLGYIPNQIARQLNAKRTYTVGIVVPDLENNFFSYMVDAMVDYATTQKYHVLLTVSREKQQIEKENIENLIGMRVDGLLVCLSQETTEDGIFRMAEKRNIPLVFFDRAFDNLSFSRVIFDDKAGAEDAVNQVIQQGYTRIAHFAGYSGTSIGRRRSSGYQEALRKNKIGLKPEWMPEGGFEWKDGYEAFRKLKSSGQLPEVIFTVNDRVALGAYKAAKEAASGGDIAKEASKGPASTVVTPEMVAEAKKAAEGAPEYKALTISDTGPLTDIGQGVFIDKNGSKYVKYKPDTYLAVADDYDPTVKGILAVQDVDEAGHASITRQITFEGDKFHVTYKNADGALKTVRIAAEDAGDYDKISQVLQLREDAAAA
ncbi:MAG TPA: LacI family DNA-binding transcriptional regulator, partial [Prolixibacteraceae bacterium]|nr:LacI family DNA-binding transcriptional regulator [Prolixibacteraceae bacterium]